MLIDLKLGKLTHEDVGQMDSYIRMFDALYKNPDDNPTLGIILCSQKSEAIVRYSVLNEGKQIFASRYISFIFLQKKNLRECWKQFGLFCFLKVINVCRVVFIKKQQVAAEVPQSEGLEIPCAAAGVLAIKSIAAQCQLDDWQKDFFVLA